MYANVFVVLVSAAILFGFGIQMDTAKIYSSNDDQYVWGEAGIPLVL